MSVPNQTPYIIYNANGLTTVFPFEFYIINSGDIQVTINGTVITSGYTVSGVGNIGGGDVIFITPPASGSVVMLERVVPMYRLTDYQDNGDLPPTRLIRILTASGWRYSVTVYISVWHFAARCSVVPLMQRVIVLRNWQIR